MYNHFGKVGVNETSDWCKRNRIQMGFNTPLGNLGQVIQSSSLSFPSDSLPALQFHRISNLVIRVSGTSPNA